MMIEHRPSGDPCSCGAPASRHRAPRKRARLWHASQGNPCKQCGKPRSAHPSRARLRVRASYDAGRPPRQAARYIVGVDGEGHDTPDGRHIYTYLCAVDERGKLVAEARNPKGLSHVECLDMLLSIPRGTLKSGFSFGYDATKIIEELAVEDRYCLVRPEARRGYVCKHCRHRWTLSTVRQCPKCASRAVRGFTQSLRIGRRRYDYLRGTLTVSDGERMTRVWDAFRFFQMSFVQALEAFDIGTPAERDAIARMKDSRDKFDKLPAKDIEDYCRLECRLLAVMMRAVVRAHERLGLRLYRYDGAGASADAMLKKYGVARYKGPRLESLPAALRDAVMRANFGGRFEQSLIGRYERPVYDFDITGAHPAALVGLPCLRCGSWEHVPHGRGLLRTIERADLALVSFAVQPMSRKARERLSWAPLPCRDEAGSLVFGTGFKGWAWKSELLAALAGWGDLVQVNEAWVYRAPCSHRPFAFMQQAYKDRVRLGKDAAGKVLKNAMNACGGKLSQGVGSRRHQSYVWAGNMTAQTRAWVLEVLAAHGADVLTVSADGIATARDLPLQREGLGGWTRECTPAGAFFARPGLYFQLDGSSARARGLGRKELLEAAPAMLRAWQKWDRQDFTMGVSVPARRFFGAKQSIVAMSRCRCGTDWPGVPEQGCPKCGRLGLRFKAGEIRAGVYGTWATHTTIVSFDPSPKRERALRKTGSYSPLIVRDLGGVESAPFVPGRTTPEAEGSRELRDLAEIE